MLFASETARKQADGTFIYSWPKVKDRRSKPMHGYRAVHLVVQVDDLPIEVQVRTRMQDRWAQITEGLADKWGRQIRYGGVPDDPERVTLASQGTPITRREIWQAVQTLSALIGRHEQPRGNEEYYTRFLSQDAPEAERQKLREWTASRIHEEDELETLLGKIASVTEAL